MNVPKPTSTQNSKSNYDQICTGASAIGCGGGTKRLGMGNHDLE